MKVWMDGEIMDGDAARVRFVERLRPEQRFDGVEALRGQLAADVAQVRVVLANLNPS